MGVLAGDDLRGKPKRPLRDPDESRAAFRTVVTDDHPATYVLEGSDDGRSWQVLFDGRTDPSDAPHRLVRLSEPRTLRFVRVTGMSVPWDARFAVSGLRVFGVDDRPLPAAVAPSVTRVEPRNALVRWEPAEGADGYNVRYGRRPDRLYHSWQVWGATELDLSTLNAAEDYWVAVDSYNAGGVTEGRPTPMPAPRGSASPRTAAGPAET